MRKSIASILPTSIGREAADPHNEQLPLNLALLLTCYERDPGAAPLAYAEGGLNVRTLEEVEPVAPRASHRKILLIEDDPVAARSLSRDLELDGFRVTIAGTCADARQLAPEFENAIVDLGLPDGDGLELAEELKACMPGLVIFTGSNDPSVQQTARDLAPLVSKSDGAERLKEELRRRRTQLL